MFFTFGYFKLMRHCLGLSNGICDGLSLEKFFCAATAVSVTVCLSITFSTAVSVTVCLSISFSLCAVITEGGEVSVADIAQSSDRGWVIDR